MRNERQWVTASYFGNQISLVVKIIYRGKSPARKNHPKGVPRFTRGCYEAPAIFESPVSAEIVSLHPGLKVFPCCSHRSFELITRARFLPEGESGGGEEGREIKVENEENMALSSACLQRWPNLLLRNQFFPQFSGSKLSNLIQLLSTP